MLIRDPSAFYHHTSFPNIRLPSLCPTLACILARGKRGEGRTYAPSLSWHSLEVAWITSAPPPTGRAWVTYMASALCREAEK